MSDGELRLAYLGNFEPRYSTENDYTHAWRNNGHSVVQYQEGNADSFADMLDDVRQRRLDLIVWTRTRDLAEKLGHSAQWQLLAEARRHKIPVVGVHLDRFWDLKRMNREHQIFTEPYFKVDLLMTADGGNQDRWEAAGVAHSWLPPGVSQRWCNLGQPRDEYMSDIAFVGSWREYHQEWGHRSELVAFLDRKYPGQVKFWPKPGEHAIRGLDLADLYASTKLVVGDSCLVPRSDGKPITNYCSDRIPETLGRGGILAHPRVEGINAQSGDPFYCSGTWMWDLNDWEELACVIESALSSDYDRDTARQTASRYITNNHTYERRVPQILQALRSRDLL